MDIGILGFKTYHNLGSVCLALEDYRSARDWWQRAIEAAPRFLPSVFALFDAALDAGDLLTARQMVEAAQHAEGADENWLRMGMKHAEALGGGEGAPALLQQALARHPRSPVVGMARARHLLQSGREQEARAHLVPLSEAGVAEAAYFLGVFAIRAGRLEEALAWMERAATLNPDHAETKSQIASLQAALGSQPLSPQPLVDTVDDVDRLSPVHHLTPSSQTLEEAVTQARRIWGWTGRRSGTNAGGSGRGYREAAAETPSWPGGSVWEEEGRLLYGLVRALKPEVIVEIGSLVGCSTSHLALACRRNGRGRSMRSIRRWSFRGWMRRCWTTCCPCRRTCSPGRRRRGRCRWCSRTARTRRGSRGRALEAACCPAAHSWLGGTVPRCLSGAVRAAIMPPSSRK